MKHILAAIIWRFRGVRVYALIGKSGTGKSFRAHLVMEKYAIECLIDDGLLIRDQRIVAGRSAKREKAYLAAVKTALFTDKKHRHEVRNALERERFRRVLIIGTSEKMVEKIATALHLPAPHKTINIEEIATSEEIETAIHYRNVQGRHIIPVPSIEVKRNYPRIMADSIKIFLKKGVGIIKKHDIYEKTVVRPAFSRKGAVQISEAALTQMIFHCIAEFSPGIQVKRVVVKNDKSGYDLAVHIDVPFGAQLSGKVHALQSYIINSIERYTGIIVDELNLVIDNISES